MKRLFAVLTLLLPALAFADADPRFAKLRDAAEPLGGLGAFLDKYIGECNDVFAGPTCKANAEAFRRSYTGKKLYMIVTEDVTTMLSPGSYQPNSGNYVINITPFFPGGRYAVTHGAPKKADAHGNPVLPLLRASGTVPEGWNGQIFGRMFTTHALRAQVVFTPRSVWSLPKPGGGHSYGVNAQIEAILLTEGRTGEVMGLWVQGKAIHIRR